MKVKFKNRYGCNICLEKIDNNTVIMSGYDGTMIRYSWSENGYKSIDPSGGPYMQTGDNLKDYFNTKQDMFINDLIHNGKQVTFFIDEVNKTNYEDPFNER